MGAVPGDTGYFSRVDDRLSMKRKRMNQLAGSEPSALLDELEKLRQRVADLEAAAAKKEAEEYKFTRLIELSGDGIIVCNEDGDIISWNHGAEIIFGINRQQAMGSKLWDIQYRVAPMETRTPEMRTRIQAMLEKFLRTGQTPLSYQYVEHDFERPDGTRRVTESIFFPIPSTRGFLAGGIVRDITARKHAEEQLLHFQLLAENSRDIILFVHERDGHILDANHAAIQAYGYAYHELLSLGMSDLTFEGMDFAAPKGDVFESIHRRKNGESFFAEVSITGAEFHHRSVSLFVIRDISERKQVQNALMQAKEELEQRVAARTAELQQAIETLRSELNERRRAQAELQASEEKYRNLVENMNDLICEVDEQARFTYVSPQYKAAFGYDPEELVGLEVTCFIHQDETSQVTRALDGLLREKKPAHDVWRFRHKNGEWRWLECTGKTYEKPSGGFGTVVISRDITERKKNEENLRRMVERFELGALAAGLGVWDWNMEKNALEWDERLYQLYGVNKEDFSGTYEGWLERVHPEDRERCHEEVLQAIRDERDYVTQFRVVWPDGTIRVLKDYGRFVRDTQGTPLRMTGVNFDITEQKHLEDQLKESQSNLLALVENTNEPILFRGKQGEIELYNTAYADLFKKVNGLEAKPGISMPNLFSKRVWPHWQELLVDGQKGGTRSVEFVQIDTLEGTLYYELGYNAVWKENEIIGYTEFFHDVTRRVLTEKALQENEERYRTVADFTYDWETWFDPEGKCLYMSPACERISGYRVDEFLGAPGLFLEIIHPEDRELVNEHIRNEVEGHAKTSLVIRMRRRDGEMIWIEHICQPVYRSDGTRFGRRASNRDVTDRQNLFQTLERRITDRTRELKMMYDLSAASSHSSDLQDFLAQALEQALKAFPGCSGAIHEADARRHNFLAMVTLGLPVADQDAGPILTFADAFAAHVYAVGSRICVDTSQSDPFAGAGPETRQQAGSSTNFTACFGVPIWVNATAWGVFSVYHSLGQFTSESIALLSTISEQIGSGVETALLRQKSKQAVILDERQRVARNLHDSVSQLMYSLVLSAQAGQNYIDSDRRVELNQTLQSISNTAQQALLEMRLIIYELRPVELEHRDLVDALRHRLDYVEKQAGFVVSFDASPSIKIPEPIKEAYYRVAQEALNNVIKHAQAKNVNIQIKLRKGRVVMEITDDGAGFDLQHVQKGIGLDSMKSRAGAIGGSLTIFSEPQKGTKVVISAPLRAGGQTSWLTRPEKHGRN
jgi:PAS domain S-box-containing protein